MIHFHKYEKIFVCPGHTGTTEAIFTVFQCEKCGERKAHYVQGMSTTKIPIDADMVMHKLADEKLNDELQKKLKLKYLKSLQ